MADINKYLDGLNMKFSEQEKQLLDIFAECWEYCHTHVCKECEYKQGNEYMKMMLCSSYQYAKRLIAADVAPVKHGEWIKATKPYPYYDYRCSACGCEEYRQIDSKGKVRIMNFCPNCGADMSNT